MSLTDLVLTLAPDRSDEPEDIFASAPGFLFTDDARNMHGDPDSVIFYKSQRFGDMQLRTADPTGETERRLFSHYLWNAGIKLAELISRPEEEGGEWGVEGERVVELGAGVGLDGIVATLAGADEVVISDYPAPVVLENIRQNAAKNIPEALKPRLRVEGHEWGSLTSPFAAKHKGHFTRILAADCYWMADQHESLVASMLHFLSMEAGARVFVIAGFHTGRARLAGFFEVAGRMGLESEEIYEEDVEGMRREWATERDGGAENVTERKRWLVVSRMRRNG